MTLRIQLFVFCALLLPCTGFSTDVFPGKIFDPKGDPAKALFTFESRREKDEAQTLFKELGGKVVMDEMNQYANGELKRYSFQQSQVDEKGEIDIRDGKVFYTFTKAGKTKTDSHKVEENMIVPDMIVGLLRKNWDALLKGETIKARFLVLDRLESVGFKFFMDDEKSKDPAAVRFVMKPSSMFVAMFAPTLYFTLEKEAPHRVVETVGRLPVYLPKVSSSGKRGWEPLVGRLVMDRPEAKVK